MKTNEFCTSKQISPPVIKGRSFFCAQKSEQEGYPSPPRFTLGDRKVIVPRVRTRSSAPPMRDALDDYAAKCNVAREAFLKWMALSAEEYAKWVFAALPDGGSLRDKIAFLRDVGVKGKLEYLQDHPVWMNPATLIAGIDLASRDLFHATVE